ncbi:MAG: hypothetical protein IPL39_11385 [Opitutaceae bacterium]|nr:hypothetical protein [Opitutaceae bacterium]
MSKLTFHSKRTGKVVALRLGRGSELFSELGTWAIDAVTNAKVASVEEREPTVELIVVDEQGDHLPDATIRLGDETAHALAYRSNTEGIACLQMQDQDTTSVHVTKDGYTEGSAFISRSQQFAVVVLADEERRRWRESMAELRCDSGSKHEAFLFFTTHGSKEAVPLLIAALGSYSNLGEGRTVACTVVHCVDALRMQTGKDFWWDAKAYHDWWEKEGKDLPDSYFDARRRTREVERKWKLDHSSPEKAPTDRAPETSRPRATPAP